MARFDGKDTKQVATTLKLSELSGVTTPAHTGADVTLFKCADELAIFQTLAKASFNEVLQERKAEDMVREVVQPLLDEVYTAESALYTANYDAMRDGNVEQVKQNVRDYAMSLLLIKAQESETMMTPEEEATLKLAQARAGMNDTQKAYFDGLTDEVQKTAFLKMAPDAMTATVELVKGVDETYVTGEGSTLSKSALGATVFDLMKTQDEKLVKMQNQIDTDAFVKVAEDADHKHLPGTAMSKACMLKTIGDLPADIQTSLNECLKAGNASLAKSFEPQAHGGSIIKSNEDKLETLAKTYAETNKVSFAKAYEAVMATDEGQAIYENMGAK